MRFSPIAVAVAAAFLSLSAVAQEKKQEAPAAQTPPMSAPAGEQSKAAKGGHDAETIKQAQTKLNVTADGRWGPQSQKALKEFQTSKGLNASGQLDQQTIAALGGGESAAAGGSASTETKTEAKTERQAPSGAAGSSTTEQKPQNPPAPPAKVEGEKKY